MANIGIIGAGRLGLAFGLLCAQKGYNVYFHDIRQEYIDSLNNGIYRTTEPYIEEFLKSNIRTVFTTDLRNVIQRCDMLYCFVATPSLPTGEYDHSTIEAVIDQLVSIDGEYSIYGKTFVIGCTTMPGYTATVQDRLSVYGCNVAYNPEFIAQGSIIDGLYHADMVLIGCTHEPTVHSLTAIYRTIMTRVPNIKVMSPTAAEITKIGVNCYLATKISYANMIGEIATVSGIESEIPIILQAIGDDSRIGRKYLGYGYGYSGVCIPRDGKALSHYCGSVGANSIIPRTIDTFNEFHHHFLKEYYIAKNPDKSIPFIFPYISYKRGTDILTESAPYRLCRELLQAGYKVHIEQDSDVITDIISTELKEYIYSITFGTCDNGYRIDI